MSNSPTNIVIVGASGHAKVIIDIIERNRKYHIVGLIDSFKRKGTKIFDYQILGKEGDLKELMSLYSFNSAIIAIGENWTRHNMHKKLVGICADIQFISIVHPTAIIGKNVSIEEGTVITAGAIVNSDARVGRFCIINTKATLGHDGELKDFSSLSPGVTTGGNVTVGNYSAVSLGANIIQGITIGDHSVVGAGSLVVDNIGDFKLVYGSPGKVVRTIKVGHKHL